MSLMRDKTFSDFCERPCMKLSTFVKIVLYLQGMGELVIAAAHQEVDLAVGEDVLGL